MQDKEEKSRKLTPRMRKFLRFYAETGNLGKAVMLAGYRCKNKKSASQMGSALLKRIGNSMEYKKILTLMGISDAELAAKGFQLLHCGQPKVECTMWKNLAHAKGWLKGVEIEELGAPIIIQGQTQEPEEPKEEKKPAPVISITHTD